jgi:hypothetical protein
MASLPEDDPTAFVLLLQWVYVGRLVPINISKNTTETGPFIDLIKLYVLAEKICLPDLAGYTITKLISSYLHHNLHPSTFAVKLAYQIMGPGSHLRSYMVNDMHYHYKVHGTDMIKLCKAFIGCDDLISDFTSLLETYKALNRKPTDPQKDVFCRWHYHRNIGDDGLCNFNTKYL